jgi:tripartite-type tricarboxylate transporter receptor subunit TctC
MEFFFKGREMKHRFGLIRGCLIAAAMVFSSVASAQEWPSRPIRLIVPFVPGGGTDILARIMAPKLSGLLGQQLIIENKPGASSIIGSQLVVQAPRDGYTLLMVDSSILINPGLRTDLPYNTLKDFTPVVHLAAGPVILVAHPSVPAKSVSELVALAKSRPDSVFYGSGGIGASTHLAGELFNLAAGVKIKHVPYKGTGEALTAVMAGEVPMTFTGISSARPAVQTGRLRALAVTGARRNAALPDVPTFAEAGQSGVDSSTHWGIFAPTGVPQEVVLRLNREINKVLADPEIKTRVAGLGYEVAGGTPEAYATLVQEEIAKWTKVIQAAQISIK